MKITKENFKKIVREVMTEESEYQAFFKKALEKTGKSIPDMSDEEKKTFFNKIDSAWQGKGEKKNEGNAFGAAVSDAKEKGEDEFKVGGETFKVESVNENFSANDIENIKKAVEGADSFMGIGVELKRAGFKYRFSTKPLPFAPRAIPGLTRVYMIKKGNKTFALINKRYADNPDFVIGSTAGKMLESKSVNEASKPTIKVVNKLKNEQGIQIVVTKTTNGETMYGGFVVRGKLQKVIPVGANKTKEDVKKRALQIWDEFGKQLGESKSVNEIGDPTINDLAYFLLGAGGIGAAGFGLTKLIDRLKSGKGGSLGKKLATSLEKAAIGSRGARLAGQSSGRYESVSKTKSVESVVNEKIAVGKMVKVDNPHWEGALGKKGPFRRKVKMIDGDNVFFTDGSNSSMKFVKESLESSITEQLVPVDKKAVDAFFNKKDFEGKNLNSDGKVLKTVGVGSQEMFTHTPKGVKMVGKVTGQYAQSLVQYVMKNHKTDLV